MSETSLVSSFGKRLRGFRENSGWTRSELARRSGVSVDMVTALEIGKCVPTLRTLVKLAEGLHVKIGYLIGE